MTKPVVFVKYFIRTNVFLSLMKQAYNFVKYALRTYIFYDKTSSICEIYCKIFHTD